MSNKTKKGSFADKFIFGLFVFSALFGIFFMIMLFDLKSLLFYFFLCWTIIYTYLVYCWLDKEKWIIMEGYATAIFEDIGILIWILVPVIGIVYSLYNLINKIDVSNYIIVLVLMISLLGLDLWLIKKKIFTLHNIDYIRNRK